MSKSDEQFLRCVNERNSLLKLNAAEYTEWNQNSSLNLSQAGGLYVLILCAKLSYPAANFIYSTGRHKKLLS